MSWRRKAPEIRSRKLKREAVIELSVYDRWKMMRSYIVILAAIAAAVSAATLFLSQYAENIFYGAYILNSLTVTVCGLIFGIKHGFKWWYAASAVFVETSVMVAFFVGRENDLIPFMFVSYLSVSFVCNAIGAIIGKIKKNNEEDW